MQRSGESMTHHTAYTKEFPAMNASSNRTAALHISPDGYTAKKAAEIVGITYRQLDYWARTDLVVPSGPASGSGSRRRYAYTELLELRAIKSLLDAGIKLEKVRDAFDYVREQLGEDVTTVNLVISGQDSVVVSSEAGLIDLLRGGQGVLNILPMAGVKDQVDAAIIELFPAPSETASLGDVDAATGTDQR